MSARGRQRRRVGRLQVRSSHPWAIPATRCASHPPCGVARLATAFLVVGVLLAGCKESVRDPLGLVPRFAPFERLPYVQAVDSSSAVVRWLALASVSDSFEVRIGRSGPWHALGAERSEPRTSVAGSVATRTVRIDDLQPSQEVSYRVWADTRLVGPFTFRTPPSPDEPSTIRVLAFGDSGYGSDPQIRLAGLMEDRAYDLAIHTGDIAYQVGSEADFTLRHFQVYRNLLARVPFFPSAGNHDLRSEGGSPYRRAFVWPNPVDDARYYSYRWGPVAFVVLDTTDEDPSTPGEERTPGADPFPEGEPVPTDGGELREGRGRQYEWLATVLSAAQADSSVRWTIVYMHHPPYSHAVGIAGHGSDVDLEREISPLFDRYGVDLVLSGHDHHYERMFPVHDAEVADDGCGPVYLLTGGGGASRFARSVGRSRLQARSSLEHHFVDLEITAGVIRGETIGDRGQTMDEFVVLPSPGDGPGGERPPGCR